MLQKLKTTKRQQKNSDNYEQKACAIKSYFKILQKMISTETSICGLQGCQIAYFQTKNPDLGKFWRVLQSKMLVFYTVVWFILQLFSIA
jgi:hypothetical protein